MGGGGQGGGRGGDGGVEQGGCEAAEDRNYNAIFCSNAAELYSRAKAIAPVNK